MVLLLGVCGVSFSEKQPDCFRFTILWIKKKKGETDLNGLLITLGPHGTSCYSVLSFKNILNSNLKADYFLFESHLILLDSDKSH